MGDTKHTPTPWEAKQWTVVSNGVVLLQTFATSAGPAGTKAAAANAALIVHAVNSLASHGARIAELEGALRDTPCPRPCNHRPDDFTVGQCVAAGECGCSTGAALHTEGE